MIQFSIPRSLPYFIHFDANYVRNFPLQPQGNSFSNTLFFFLAFSFKLEVSSNIYDY